METTSKAKTLDLVMTNYCQMLMSNRGVVLYILMWPNKTQKVVDKIHERKSLFPVMGFKIINLKPPIQENRHGVKVGFSF